MYSGSRKNGLYQRPVARGLVPRRAAGSRYTEKMDSRVRGNDGLMSAILRPCRECLYSASSGFVVGRELVPRRASRTYYTEKMDSRVRGHDGLMSAVFRPCRECLYSASSGLVVGRVLALRLYVPRFNTILVRAPRTARTLTIPPPAALHDTSTWQRVPRHSRKESCRARLL